MNTADGKSIFVWQIKMVGQWEEFAVRLKKLGATRVIVKVADGPVNYNLRPVGTQWLDDLLPAFVQFLKKVSIEVWGFQYVYHLQAVAEARCLANRCNTLGLDGVVVDAESEVENMVNKQAAIDYMRTLRPLVKVPIALSSFRFPSVHGGLPWKNYFDNGVDIHMPQVYWVQATNSAEQLRRSYKELMAIKNLPFVPVGPAYYEAGWRPRLQDMTAFHVAALDLGLKGEAWWCWDDEGISKYLEYENLITTFNFPMPLPPQPPVTEPTVNERLVDLERRVRFLEETCLGTSFQEKTS